LGAIELWAQGLEPNDARRIGDAAPGPTGAREVYGCFDNDARVRGAGGRPLVAGRSRRDLGIP
jgi:hypothetical protein